MKSDDVRVHVGVFPLDQPTESVRLGVLELAEPERCDRAVLADEGHTIGDCPERCEVGISEGNLAISGVSEEGLRDGSHNLVGHSGTGEIGKRIVGFADLGIEDRDHFVRHFVRYGMVVGDNHIHSLRPRIADDLDIARPAVDRDDELYVFLRELVDEVVLHPVPVMHAVGEAVGYLHPDLSEKPH